MGNHHPLRSDREIKDPAEIKAVLKAGKFASIAMVSGDEPYVVTLNYGYDEADHALYFHAALKGHKLDCLEKNNRVCATIILDGGYEQGKCEHHYTSLVIRGTMDVVRDLEVKKRAMKALIWHLEKDPQPVYDRNMKSDASYDRVNMICLKIEDISGKKGK